MAKAKEKKVKNVEEDTNRTETQVPIVHQASRDDVDPGEGNDPEPEVEPEVESQAADTEPELDETVVLEDPTPEPEPIDFEDMDDPRMRIAKKHDEKHRNFSENDESELETDDPTDILDESDDEPEMVEVKVYGETKLVEKSKVDKAGGVQAYQKAQAVDAGMQENARQRDSNISRTAALDERERRMNAQAASLPTPGATPGQPPDDPPTPGDQTIVLAQRYQEAVYDGEENAPQLLVDLVQAGKDQGTPINEDEIISRAANELERRNRQKNVRAATVALIGAHPELDKDSDKFDQRLWTAIDDETPVVERQHPEFEPQQVLDEAYKRISKWKGTHKTDTMTDKAKEKRNMNRPRANSGRYQKPPPPPARTASDYVNDLRKSRGQGV